MVVVSTGEDYAACQRKELEPRCVIHGGRMGLHADGCQTVNVLADVRAERARQFAMYGTNEDLEDGTGPQVNWLGSIAPYNAKVTEEYLREAYEAHEDTHGKPTFRHLVLEEMAEAFMESSPRRLREELLQVAALAVSWIEKIDARIPEWRDLVDGEVPEVGDIAFRKDTELDSRVITYADDEVIFIRIGSNEMHGPLDPADYTFRRRVR